MRRAAALAIALALGAAVIGIGGPADASGPTVGPAREAGPAIDGDTNPAAKIGTAFDGTNQPLVWTRLQPVTGHRRCELRRHELRRRVAGRSPPEGQGGAHQPRR